MITVKIRYASGAPVCCAYDAPCVPRAGEVIVVFGDTWYRVRSVRWVPPSTHASQVQAIVVVEA